jgi:glycine dehydrogenase subunit 1
MNNMRYLPHTEEEIGQMLQVIGKDSLEELFVSIPDACRRQIPIELPEAKSEYEMLAHMNELGRMMKVDPDTMFLLGAGSNDHYIPELVGQLAGRSEFLTSYTPYQPEISQGTLQAIFEYQTLTARLLGVDVANASMYDGASALAEGLLMAIRLAKKRKTVALSQAIHPHYRQVVHTYFQATEYKVVELAIDGEGRTDFSILASLQDDLAAVAVASPNFFGVVEDIALLANNVHQLGALLVCSFSEPLAFGLYKSPGEQGADIVCGEGQSLGLAKSFGGAALGMFGCKQEFVRALPGRLVGQTVDLDGKRGFVLTLNTREQHIRREKATSNICSNQGVCALTAAIYMSALGGTGLKQLARLNYDKSEYFKQQLIHSGAEILSNGPTFNEFVVKFSCNFEVVRKKLLAKNIVAGLALEPYYQQLKDCYLFGVTEKTTRVVMDMVAEEVQNGR